MSIFLLNESISQFFFSLQKKSLLSLRLRVEIIEIFGFLINKMEKWMGETHLLWLRDLNLFEMSPKRQRSHGRIQHTHAAADLANVLDNNVDVQIQVQNEILAPRLAIHLDLLESLLVLDEILKYIHRKQKRRKKLIS